MSVNIIPNYYKVIPKKYLDETTKISYPNYEKLKISLPFQMVITGKTGSFKTNLLIHLIRCIGVFNKIVLLCKNPKEPLYAFIIDTMRKLEAKSGESILFVSTDCEELPDLEELEGNNTIFICDDQICESEKAQKKVIESWIMGRKCGVSSVYLSQDYFKVPLTIRNNTGFLILKTIVSVSELKRILHEFSLTEDPKKIVKLYNYIQSKGATNFLMIDRNTINPDYRYRMNFTGVPIKKLE